MLVLAGYNAEKPVARLGGKGLGLCKLMAMGMDVPGGLVIEPDDGQREIEVLYSSLSTVKDHPRYAVRSSAIAEDGSTHSYAGQFESRLNVTLNKLTSAIDKIRAGGGSVEAYNAAHHLPPTKIAVVVQRMIANPDYAGVLLTQDPVQPDWMIVEFTKGLGDKLVSGKVTPNTALYRRSGLDGTVYNPKFKELAEKGREIEHHWGCPMDIEWAMKNGRLWFLQARPITGVKALAKES